MHFKLLSFYRQFFQVGWNPVLSLPHEATILHLQLFLSLPGRLPAGLRQREGDIDRLPLVGPRAGAGAGAQARALTGNRSGHLSLRPTTPSPPSRTGQGLPALPHPPGRLALSGAEM